ncbi:transposase, partial [Streptomyces sp. DSM 41634]|uniref:transposase n=1 Tax=Streptomyces sp. DSM 41634 TaxID=3448656 RepID=UPI00403FEF70
MLRDRPPQRGGRWRDHRPVIDAIAFKYRTGTPWMDLPEHFGSWKGAHNGCGSAQPTAPGRRCSPPCSPRPTPKATSTGSSRSTPPSSVPTSTPPGPGKGGPGRRAGQPADAGAVGHTLDHVG